MLVALTLLVLNADISVTASPAVATPTGAVLAPAALPAGALALYGLVGAPEVGAGYRQGFAALEFEAKALFNYLELSGLIDAGLRVPLIRRDKLLIAPIAGLGLKLNSGARFYNGANFASVSLRPRIGAVLSYAASETAAFIATLDLPWAISLGVAGHQVTPTLGIGGEFYVGRNLSLLAMGQLGFDFFKEPLGVPQARVAWGVRLGIGWRLF
jgi:hypothetical protein